MCIEIVPHPLLQAGSDILHPTSNKFVGYMLNMITRLLVKV